jgi:hypothetical protein
MEKAKTTPKDFFLWVGAMVSLYWSVVAFIFLLFDYINYAMPDPLKYYPSDPYQSSIPYDMASIIVLFPLYLAIMWVVRRDIAADRSRAEVWVRRWLIIFTLFVAGVTVAVDLIVLLTSFLRGEDITLAFILKVLVVLFVAAVAFMHFIADLWGYWSEYPARKNMVGIAVTAVAALSIVAGFFIVGTPHEARLYRFDEQKVNDLQNIQYQVVNYYQHKQKLPASLADINDPISGYSIPNDPQTGLAYEYDGNIHVAAGGNPTFSVCADFNKPSRAGSNGMNRSYPTAPMPAGVYDRGMDNWQHAMGHVCFDRTIDPQLYPSTPNPQIKGL